MRHRNEKSTPKPGFSPCQVLTTCDMVHKHRPCSGLGDLRFCVSNKPRVMLKAARPQNPHGEKCRCGTDFVFRSNEYEGHFDRIRTVESQKRRIRHISRERKSERIETHERQYNCDSEGLMLVGYDLRRWILREKMTLVYVWNNCLILGKNKGEPNRVCLNNTLQKKNQIRDSALMMNCQGKPQFSSCKHACQLQR